MSSAPPVFDAVVHAPQRLQVCAILARGDDVEFGALRDSLEVSDATLSKHLRTLTEAGYVELRRIQRPRGQAKAWVSLTAAGTHALHGHFAFLNSIAP